MILNDLNYHNANSITSTLLKKLTLILLLIELCYLEEVGTLEDSID